MNQSHPPGIAGTISDLLLAWAAIGRGVKLPESFNRAPGLVYTAALCDATQAAFQQAEATFSDEQAEARRPLRERLEEIDAALAELKGKRNAPHDPALAMMGDIGALSKVELSKEAKQLREKLALLPAVTWDDPDAGRATLLESMTKAAFGSLTVTDFSGNRIGKATTSNLRLITEAQLVALTDPNSNAVALIRSSATGGANIHTLAGTAKPVLYCVTRLTQQSARKLAKRIVSKQPGFNGGALIIQEETDAHRETTVSAETYLNLLRKVFTLGDADKVEQRIRLEYETPGLASQWSEFSRRRWSHFLSKTPPEASRKLEDRMEASFRTITSFASMAAFAAAIIRTLPTDGPHSGTVTITEADLAAADAAAQFLVSQSYALASYTARVDNAATAREARKPGSEAVAKVSAFLRATIQDAKTGMISRKRALQIPGMTAATLDMLASGVEFLEVTGKDNIRMGKTERAYCLRSEVTLDADEAFAELEAATVEYARNKATIDPIEAERVYVELSDKATKNNQGPHMLPCVPLTQMTPRQIQQLPRIYDTHPTDLSLRGQPHNPEPAHLMPVVDGEETLLEADTVNLWFRCDHNGMSFRPGGWKRSNLGFSERWGPYDNQLPQQQ